MGALRTEVLVLVVGLMGLAGCDLILGTVPEGRLEATVEDASRVGSDSSVAGDYEGTGSYDMYNTATDLDGIEIISHGVGESEGEEVAFYLIGDGWPDEGEYVLNMYPSGTAQAKRVGASGSYSVTRLDGAVEAYWARTGRLVITEARRRYMEGSFTITGELCLVEDTAADPVYQGPCAEPLPIVIPDTARSTEVSGTFVVKRDELP